MVFESKERKHTTHPSRDQLVTDFCFSISPSLSSSQTLFLFLKLPFLLLFFSSLLLHSESFSSSFTLIFPSFLSFFLFLKVPFLLFFFFLPSFLFYFESSSSSLLSTLLPPFWLMLLLFLPSSHFHFSSSFLLSTLLLPFPSSLSLIFLPLFFSLFLPFPFLVWRDEWKYRTLSLSVPFSSQSIFFSLIKSRWGGLYYIWIYWISSFMPSLSCFPPSWDVQERSLVSFYFITVSFVGFRGYFYWFSFILLTYFILLLLLTFVTFISLTSYAIINLSFYPFCC